MDRRTIQRYENGGRDPRFVELLLIADAIGVTLEELVCQWPRPIRDGGREPTGAE